MKTNAIVRIVIFSLAILILLGILASVLLFNLYIIDGRIQTDHYAPTELPIGIMNHTTLTSEIRNIEIEWVAGSITIESDDSASEITVTEYAQTDCEYNMVCKQSGQTLKIQYSKESMEFPSFGINVDTCKDLVITVPAGWSCKSLEIDTASASLDIIGLTIGEFDFDGASGICNLENCHVDEMDVDTASGNVIFVGTLGVLECDTASANCSITVFNAPTSIDMDAASGDLELILPENTSFTFRMETMSGEFESDFEVKNSSGAYIHGDGSCRIDISAMSGDVYIYKNINPTDSNPNYHSE